MNYKTLPYFVKIVEHRTLAAAGKDLNVSTSTLSRYLSNLETLLGTALFYRADQKLTLTKAGELYYQGVKKLIELQNKNRYELKQLMLTDQHKIRIGLTPSGAAFLTSFYLSLMQNFPEYRIEIAEGYAFELLDGIRSGEIDMLLGYYNPQILSDVRIATFYRSEVFLIVPSYHPVAEFGSPNTEDVPIITKSQLFLLKDVPFAYMSEHTIMGTIISKEFQTLKFKPFYEIRSRNSQLINSLIRTGYYAGVSYKADPMPLGNVVYFHMPSPVYMYTSAVFRPDYEPGAIEAYICKRHVEEYAQAVGYQKSFNSSARELWNRFPETAGELEVVI